MSQYELRCLAFWYGLVDDGARMEFSRALARACFVGLMWLMVVSGILFAALALAQYLRAESNADPALTLGSALGCLLFAMLLRHLASRIVQNS